MIILDTHALLWFDQGHPNIGSQTLDIIESALETKNLAVSAISFWEISLLVNRGRITLSIPIEKWRDDLLQTGLKEFSINGEIAILSTQLENFHADPADRLIVATALYYKAMLITVDQKILTWQGNLEVHNAYL